MKVSSFIRGILAMVCVPGLVAQAGASPVSKPAIEAKLQAPLLKSELKILPGSAGASRSSKPWPFNGKNKAQRDRLRAAFARLNKI